MMIVHALRSPISFLSVTRSGMPESRLRSLSFIILWLSVLFLSTPSISARARTESWTASLESPLRIEARWKSRAGAASRAPDRMLTSISALIHIHQTISAYYTWPVHWSTFTKPSVHTTHDLYTDHTLTKPSLHTTHDLCADHTLTNHQAYNVHYHSQPSVHTTHDRACAYKYNIFFTVIWCCFFFCILIRQCREEEAKWERLDQCCQLISRVKWHCNVVVFKDIFVLNKKVSSRYYKL